MQERRHTTGKSRAVVAALLRRAKHLGSLDRNAFSRDAAGYLELESAGRVVEIQGEGTAVRLAALTQSERLYRTVTTKERIGNRRTTLTRWH